MILDRKAMWRLLRQMLREMLLRLLQRTKDRVVPLVKGTPQVLRELPRAEVLKLLAELDDADELDG